MSNQQSQSSTPTSNSPIDWEYLCEHCSGGFDASMVHQIEVVNDTEAKLMCPWCKKTASYERPEGVERPPAIVTTSVITKKDDTFTGKEFTKARVFFEGGAWLQYHESISGRVREEMFNADGKKRAEFEAEFEHDDPEECLSESIDLYEKFTVRGLRIQMPHVADALLNGH